jgi:hypothetical protein
MGGRFLEDSATLNGFLKDLEQSFLVWEYKQSNKIPYFDGKDREDIESYMNYLLTEDEVLFSRFLIFFLSCTNQTKFRAKKEKEYNPSKSESWLMSNVLKKPFFLQPKPEAKPEEPQYQVSEQQNPNVDLGLHIFLEEAHPYLSGNAKLYSK